MKHIGKATVMQSQSQNYCEVKSGTALYMQVRGDLVSKGTNFAKWCEKNEISRQYAARVLSTDCNGKKALELKSRILADTIFSEKTA